MLDKFGLTLSVYRHRKDSGWTFDEIFHTPKLKTRYHKNANRKIKYEYKGKMYYIDELAKMSEVSHWTIRMRLEKGWTVKEAVETPTRANINQRYGCYSYKGKEYSLKELSKISGLTRKQLYKRIWECGWTIEEAVETPLKKPREGLIKKSHAKKRNRKNVYMYKGKEYTLTELAELSGLPRMALWDRLSRGKIWASVEEAVDTPIIKRKREVKESEER